MKKWTLTSITVSAFLSAGLYSLPAHSASFDCSKASSTVEKLICASPELSKLDDELALQYSAEMEEAKDNEYDYTEQTRAEQIQWLIFQRNTCNDTACLIREYQERLGAKPKLRGEWSGGDEIKPQDLPTSRAFGTFNRSMQISVYDQDAPKEYRLYQEDNSIDIHSVSGKPYLAVIDSLMVFDNAHMCSITDELATWSGSYWTINNYELDEATELRLYPATYKGKPQILVRDMGDQYRRLNCGMRGYFDGLVFERQ